jgi:hypothetical protein
MLLFEFYEKNYREYLINKSININEFDVNTNLFNIDEIKLLIIILINFVVISLILIYGGFN